MSTSPGHVSNPSGFLAVLPREIRDRIYSYVLAPTGRMQLWVAGIWTKHRSTELSFTPFPLEANVMPLTYGLLQTCTQIRDEGTYILWRDNSLVVPLERYENESLIKSSKVDWTQLRRVEMHMQLFRNHFLMAERIAAFLRSTSKNTDYPTVHYVFRGASTGWHLSLTLGSPTPPKAMLTLAAVQEVLEKNQAGHDAERSLDFQLGGAHSKWFSGYTSVGCEEYLAGLHDALKGDVSLNGLLCYSKGKRLREGFKELAEELRSKNKLNAQQQLAEQGQRDEAHSTSSNQVNSTSEWDLLNFESSFFHDDYSPSTTSSSYGLSSLEGGGGVGIISGAGSSDLFGSLSSSSSQLQLGSLWSNWSNSNGGSVGNILQQGDFDLFPVTATTTATAGVPGAEFLVDYSPLVSQQEDDWTDFAGIDTSGITTGVEMGFSSYNNNNNVNSDQHEYLFVEENYSGPGNTSGMDGRVIPGAESINTADRPGLDSFLGNDAYNYTLRTNPSSLMSTPSMHHRVGGGGQTLTSPPPSSSSSCSDGSTTTKSPPPPSISSSSFTPSSSTSNHNNTTTTAKVSSKSPSVSSPKASLSSTSTPSSSAIKKRTLNTLAARRYRQRRVDQVTELEALLKEAREERDSLKEKCARLEGEVGVLRGLVASKKE